MLTEPFDAIELIDELTTAVAGWRFSAGNEGRMERRCEQFVSVLEGCPGSTLQDRWDHFEVNVWSRWVAGHDRVGGEFWRWATWAVVLTRAARPGWGYMVTGRVAQWLLHLPAGDPLAGQADLLRGTMEGFDWVSPRGREVAVSLGIRVLLVGGRPQVDAITDADLAGVPSHTKGQDILDAALCRLGVLARTPKRGITRRLRVGRLSPEELVDQSDTPGRFRPVTTLYLETYSARISDVYATLRHKQIALAHLWRFIDQHHPEVRSCSELTPLQGRGFVTYAIERARLVRRGPGASQGDGTTAHAWLTDVRCFFG